MKHKDYKFNIGDYVKADIDGATAMGRIVERWRRVAHRIVVERVYYKIDTYEHFINEENIEYYEQTEQHNP